MSSPSDLLLRARRQRCRNPVHCLAAGFHNLRLLGCERQPLQSSKHQHAAHADEQHVRAALRRAGVSHRRDLRDSVNNGAQALAWCFTVIEAHMPMSSATARLCSEQASATGAICEAMWEMIKSRRCMCQGQVHADEQHVRAPLRGAGIRDRRNLRTGFLEMIPT